MATIHDFNGKIFHPTMVNPCAKCMFGSLSCGTFLMCPTSAGETAHKRHALP